MNKSVVKMCYRTAINDQEIVVWLYKSHYMSVDKEYNITGTFYVSLHLAGVQIICLNQIPQVLLRTWQSCVATGPM